MLSPQERLEIKKALESSQNPLFLFHDDADGLASFLLCYKYLGFGKGIPVKATPIIDDRFLRKVEEINPDKIFVLDVAMIEQSFVDSVKKPIIWVDHHEMAIIKGVKYYNPRSDDPTDNACIARTMYEVLGQNVWIAAVGTIGDWQLPPEFRSLVVNRLPHLLPEHITTPEAALFESKIGYLVKMFNFVLKGPTKEGYAAIKALCKIQDADEIIEEKTENAKFLIRKFRAINNQYEALLTDAKKCVDNTPLIVYTYPENKISLSGEISNEILYKNPDKVIIIARHYHGEMKTSFRSGKNIVIRDVLAKAIVGIQGRYGGHEHACGGVIKEEDWNQFINNIREILKEEYKLQ